MNQPFKRKSVTFVPPGYNLTVWKSESMVMYRRILSFTRLRNTRMADIDTHRQAAHSLVPNPSELKQKK